MSEKHNLQKMFSINWFVMKNHSTCWGKQFQLVAIWSTYVHPAIKILSKFGNYSVVLITSCKKNKKEFNLQKEYQQL